MSTHDDVAVSKDRTAAAAILVQTVFDSDERLRTLLRERTATKDSQQDAEATASFLQPWFAAMFKMITNIRG